MQRPLLITEGVADLMLGLPSTNVTLTSFEGKTSLSIFDSSSLTLKLIMLPINSYTETD